MLNFEYIQKENIKEHHANSPEIPNHLYRTLVIGGSGSGKTNVLYNLISWEIDVNKIYSYAKDPFEAKYQLLIDKQLNSGFRYFNDSKAFIEDLNDIEDICKCIKEYNPNEKRKIILFDDIVADILVNKKLDPIATEKILLQVNLSDYIFLYRAKEISKTVYKNVMNSMKL